MLQDVSNEKKAMIILLKVVLRIIYSNAGEILQSNSFSENLETSDINFLIRVFGFVIDVLAILNVYHPIMPPIYHLVYPLPSFL